MSTSRYSLYISPDDVRYCAVTPATDQHRVNEQLLAAVIPLGRVNVVALVFAPLIMTFLGQGRLHGDDLRVWTLAIWFGAAAQALAIFSHRWSGLNRTWERRYATAEALLGSICGLALAIRVEDGEPLSGYLIVTCFLVMTTSASIVAFAGSRLIGFSFLLAQWGVYALVAAVIGAFDFVVVAVLVLCAAYGYLFFTNRVLVGALNAQLLAGELADELRIHASTDSLTGLLNRRAVMEELEQALTSDCLPTVLFVDLDGFKAINDRHGHGAGDEVLMTVGRRLVQTVRTGDLVGRLGGDEFVAILLRGLQEGEAVELAQRIKSELAVPVGANRYHMTASVGCALARPDESADGILGRADALMYQAKQTGGDAIRLSFVEAR